MLSSSVKSNAIDSQMSVLERQQARLNYQQPLTYLTDSVLFGNNSDNCLGELLSGRGMKPNPGLGNGWMLNYGNGSDSGTSNHIPRTASFPTDVAATMAEMTANKGRTASSDVSFVVGNESSKKRKAEQVEKKTESTDEGSKITEDNTKSNKKKKASDDSPKLDYIHVRARRGQATDSHSLAERVRREKISERMKYLQDLVPGCNKITGKAGMLDEIINYVQSLQRQVEFLSMKLANVNLCSDHFEIDSYKEMFPMCISSVVNDDQPQFSALTQGVSCPGIDVNPVLRRTTSAPVHIQDPLHDSSCFSQQIQHLTSWDTELQNLFTMEYLQGKSSFISQPFTGYSKTGHVKIEM